MKKQQILRIFCFVFIVLFASMASAQEIELQLYTSMVSMNPIFEEGYPGDLTHMLGYSYVQDYVFGEQRIKIGTETGEVRLPEGQYFSPMSQVTEAIMVGSLAIPGIGTFNTTGTLVILGGPIAAQTGSLVGAWVQSYSEGTDILAGFYGLSSGTGKINIYTGEGDIPFKMILMPPISQ